MICRDAYFLYVFAFALSVNCVTYNKSSDDSLPSGDFLYPLFSSVAGCIASAPDEVKTQWNLFVTSATGAISARLDDVLFDSFSDFLIAALAGSDSASVLYRSSNTLLLFIQREDISVLARQQAVMRLLSHNTDLLAPVATSKRIWLKALGVGFLCAAFVGGLLYTVLNAGRPRQSNRAERALLCHTRSAGEDHMPQDHISHEFLYCHGGGMSASVPEDDLRHMLQDATIISPIVFNEYFMKSWCNHVCYAYGEHALKKIIREISSERFSAVCPQDEQADQFFDELSASEQKYKKAPFNQLFVSLVRQCFDALSARMEGAAPEEYAFSALGSERTDRSGQFSFLDNRRKHRFVELFERRMKTPELRVKKIPLIITSLLETVQTSAGSAGDVDARGLIAFALWQNESLHPYVRVIIDDERIKRAGAF